MESKINQKARSPEGLHNNIVMKIKTIFEQKGWKAITYNMIKSVGSLYGVNLTKGNIVPGYEKIPDLILVYDYKDLYNLVGNTHGREPPLVIEVDINNNDSFHKLPALMKSLNDEYKDIEFDIYLVKLRKKIKS